MSAAHSREFDIVLVWKIDRFGRSLKHLVNALADLDSYGVTFVSLKDNLDLSTPSGRLTPGYVGFDQGGLLTDGVDQNPHCVLLLDEIEKAHPDLFNVLLQVMDHGKLTDHNGKQVDFRNVILIMTTNAGAAEMAKAGIGFGSTQRVGEDEEAIKRMFSPEFRNRLDAVIAFSRLSRDMISRVVEKFIFQLEAQLADRNVMIELSPEAMDWIADHGYDELYGARPLARVIQEHIKKPLAEELLFGKLEGGGTVRVVVEERDSRKVLAFEVIESKPLVKVEDTDSSNDGEGGDRTPTALIPKVPLKIVSAIRKQDITMAGFVPAIFVRAEDLLNRRTRDIAARPTSLASTLTSPRGTSSIPLTPGAGRAAP